MPPPSPPSPIPSPDTGAIAARLRAAGCVFAEDEAALLVDAAATPAALEDMVERRIAGLPLEHVIGWTDFCGVRVKLATGVFVPRHRTEFLVREAARLTRTGALVVDLCCGSGALGVALAALVGSIQLHAADIDSNAVSCARGNVAPVGGTVHQGDLFAALPESLRGGVDILLANTPYVPTADIELLPREARDHEPRLALDGGADGLDLQRRVATGAIDWLAPRGHVLMETSVQQAPSVLEILTSVGLRARVATFDDLEATVVIGTRHTYHH